MAKTQYERELESLIEQVLLPKYIEHSRWIGEPANLNQFPKHLVQHWQQQQKIPALFLPKKKLA